MRFVLVGAVCVALGFGGGYVAFGRTDAVKVTTCSTHTTGRIDLSTGKLARESVCVTR